MVKDFDISNLPAGLLNLTEGYIDYATEVIVSRALVNVLDGCKPVNRRILFTLFDNGKGISKGVGKLGKSQTYAGNVLKYHPHGDGSVYGAMIPMSDGYGGAQIPLLHGIGNWGGVHTTSSAAASRYTECCLNEYAEMFFGELDGVPMVPNFDSTCSEPVVLPVKFPITLCNATSGIAVGFKSNMPSFNFNDVLDLSIEYLETGNCKTVICPDFTTGGYYIKNDRELEKLMKTGSASLKLRGKVEITGKEIKVVEYPYGKTIQGLQKQTDAADIAGVKVCGNLDDFDHGTVFYVECTSKNRTNEVLHSLYRKTDLQSNFTADMTCIHNGKPKTMGVWEITKVWCEWRKTVLEADLKCQMGALKQRMAEANAFMEVINHPEKKDELVRLVYQVSKQAGIDYIKENYDTTIITPELAKWVVNRRLPEYKDGGKYATEYESCMVEVRETQSKLDDLSKAVADELRELKSRYGSRFPRRTEVTTVDYEFSKEDDIIARDDSDCVFSLRNGFLKKMHFSAGTENEPYEIDGTASDTLVMIDNRGRVLRVYCEDLPYSNSTSDLGTYLPKKYFEFEETDDYEIIWFGRLEDKKKMIIYKDGNIGFVDMREWIGNNRKVRVIEKGIATAYADIVGAVIDVPDMLYVLDSNGKVGCEVVADIKQKERTARTRVFTLPKDTVLASYAGMSLMDGMQLVDNYTRYLAPKLQYLEDSNSYHGTESTFTQM